MSSEVLKVTVHRNHNLAGTAGAYIAGADRSFAKRIALRVGRRVEALQGGEGAVVGRRRRARTAAEALEGDFTAAVGLVERPRRTA
jgi:hypothetical protein